MLTFGPLSLDEDAGRLWFGELTAPLRPKSFAVLRELVRCRGRLVTKAELFRTCWPGTTVSQTVLRVCIREIRAALAAQPNGAVSVESVGRRGYRLVTHESAVEPRVHPLIGRDRELAMLRRALARADTGLAQVVFIAGEPGMGKTTLLDHFVEDVRTTSRTRVASGRCVELLGTSEPYLPILDLLARLCTDDGNEGVLATLDRQAPSWVVQMPGVADAQRAESLRRRVSSPNRDRILRELGDAFEALAADRTLIVVLEDLHWSDSSSVHALAYLAQRIRTARLLVVGSYRPADLLRGGHPLHAVTQALLAHRRASVIPLVSLTLPDTESYLARRFAGQPVDPTLGREIHARSRGNPLFMTATVDYLLERRILAAPEGRWQLAAPLDGVVPESVRHLALRQLEGLAAAERRVLDAASVVGADFAVATVAAATGLGPDDVEDVCATLTTRNELVVPAGTAIWPDGTLSARYMFRHILYREVLEQELRPTSRRRLHRAVAERLEAAWNGRADEIAAELAIHFGAADDPERAIRHHVAAAARARSRFADAEVIVHLRAALERIAQLPDGRDRSRTELECLLDLGGALVATRGAASDEGLDVYRRALLLADALDLPQARFHAQSAFYTFDLMRGELRRARERAEDLLVTAARLPMPFFRFVGHVSLGSALFNIGELDGARRNLEQAHAMWRPEFPVLALDPSVACRALIGFTALLQADPSGVRWIHDALEHAAAINSPYNLSYARELAAQYHAHAGDRALALEHATQAAALATEHGFIVHAAVVDVVRGWALRDVDLLRRGIAEYEASGQLVATSFFRALLVEVLLDLDRVPEALAELAVARGFVERSGEQRHVPELHRLEGECLRRSGPDAGGRAKEVAGCLRRAVSLARERGARLWEQRATAALALLVPESI